MNTVANYVNRLTEDEVVTIINDYEQFEEQGSIGDVPLRRHARALCHEMGIDTEYHITTWMNQLAFECYRRFAQQHKIYVITNTQRNNK